MAFSFCFSSSYQLKRIITFITDQGTRVADESIVKVKTKLGIINQTRSASIIQSFGQRRDAQCFIGESLQVMLTPKKSNDRFMVIECRRQYLKKQTHMSANEATATNEERCVGISPDPTHVYNLESFIGFIRRQLRFSTRRTRAPSCERSPVSLHLRDAFQTLETFERSSSSSWLAAAE